MKLSEKIDKILKSTIRRVCVYYAMSPKDIPNDYISEAKKEILSAFKEIVPEKKEERSIKKINNILR